MYHKLSSGNVTKRCLISAMKICAARISFAARATPAKNLHQIKKRTGEACKSVEPLVLLIKYANFVVFSSQPPSHLR